MRSVGKHAIVTGAASGIGLATANRLARSGEWNLTLVDLDADAIRTAADFELDGHLVHPGDISDPASVESVFLEARKVLGPLHALANIAGLSTLDDVKLEEVSVETFDRILSVNLRGAFLMCKRALPLLRESGGGAIVNVGSVASILGVGGASYVASKHGIVGLSRHIAYRYANENIRSTVVCPGPTATPMIAISRAKGQVPVQPGVIGRDAEPDEIAALITFLMSDDAAMITGSVHAVDGGFSQH